MKVHSDCTTHSLWGLVRNSDDYDHDMTHSIPQTCTRETSDYTVDNIEQQLQRIAITHCSTYLTWDLTLGILFLALMSFLVFRTLAVDCDNKYHQQNKNSKYLHVAAWVHHHHHQKETWTIEYDITTCTHPPTHTLREHVWCGCHLMWPQCKHLVCGGTLPRSKLYLNLSQLQSDFNLWDCCNASACVLPLTTIQFRCNIHPLTL